MPHYLHCKCLDLASTLSQFRHVIYAWDGDKCKRVLCPKANVKEIIIADKMFSLSIIRTEAIKSTMTNAA